MNYTIIKGDNHFTFGTSRNIAEVTEGGSIILNGTDITEFANYETLGEYCDTREEAEAMRDRFDAEERFENDVIDELHWTEQIDFSGDDEEKTYWDEESTRKEIRGQICNKGQLSYETRLPDNTLFTFPK